MTLLMMLMTMMMYDGHHHQDAIRPQVKLLANLALDKGKEPLCSFLFDRRWLYAATTARVMASERGKISAAAEHAMPLPGICPFALQR